MKKTYRITFVVTYEVTGEKQGQFSASFDKTVTKPVTPEVVTNWEEIARARVYQAQPTMKVIALQVTNWVVYD
ncbi:MAG: hypothetical protein R3250_18060 [Melioribacteraceae bacterium]|nr:hypothetical protein [Melioribacteraceae bacterium]